MTTKIEPDEAAEVMTVLTAMDRWLQVTEPMAVVWAQALTAKGIRLEDARAAAMRLVTGRAKADATPGLLIDEVRALRRDRLRAAGEDALVPPDNLEPGWYPQWLRAAKRYVGDGLPVPAALDAADLEVGVTREELGPPASRSLGHVIERAVGA